MKNQFLNYFIFISNDYYYCFLENELIEKIKINDLFKIIKSIAVVNTLAQEKEIKQKVYVFIQNFSDKNCHMFYRLLGILDVLVGSYSIKRKEEFDLLLKQFNKE